MISDFQVLTQLSELKLISGDIYLAMGTFDGMHLGHQKVISEAVDTARSFKSISSVLTFSKAPSSVLCKNKLFPHPLFPLEKRIAELKKRGVQLIILIEFTPDFSSLSPQEFIQRLVRNCSQLKAVFVGEDWKFGNQGSGDISLLKKLGKIYNFEVNPIPVLEEKGGKIGSTLIKKLLLEGKMGEVERYLGRSFLLSGIVLEGKKWGRKLGFPTINLCVNDQSLPKKGVWAVQAIVEGNWYQGVANLGFRPTYGDKEGEMLEVHLFDFSKEVYGEEVSVRFLTFLREEKFFKNEEFLREQISDDVQLAKKNLCSELFPSCSS